jgi:antitoxin (DNA-binding transcriptional repressor) of toxin-antitoxin stability system
VNWRYHEHVATFRISEADAARNFAGLMARVRAGEEVIIESGSAPVAVIKAPFQPHRKIKDILALLPDDDTMRMGPDFADDVEAAIATHREPLNPPDRD